MSTEFTLFPYTLFVEQKIEPEEGLRRLAEWVEAHKNLFV